jgi:methionine-S-sulfoxide reductase
MRIFVFVLGFLFNLNFILGEDGGKTMQSNKTEKATFAGGCFWCMQPVYDLQPGVLSTMVGYTGGKEKNPTYEEVSAHQTSHAEAIQIVYDPSKIAYRKLLEIYWHNIDPTALNRQFADAGEQYRTAIYYHNEEQKQEALASKEELQKSGKYDKPIVTEIVPASEFYNAEEYHQKYYEKNPVRYQMYKVGSGREAYLKKMWGDKK